MAGQKMDKLFQNNYKNLVDDQEKWILRKYEDILTIRKGEGVQE